MQTSAAPVDRQRSAIRAHRNNLERYCRLLAMELTDLERAFLHRRIAETRLALDELTNTRAATIPADQMLHGCCGA